jgi:hypothetical protein
MANREQDIKSINGIRGTKAFSTDSGRTANFPLYSLIKAGKAALACNAIQGKPDRQTVL